MAGLSNYAAGGVLNLLTGRAAFSLPVAYVALFTVAPTDAGGGTEVVGGSYARVSTTPSTWNPPSGTDPSSITNGTAITFPISTASWGNIVAAGLFDASAAGNLLMWDYMGAYPWLPFTCTVGSPGVLTAPGHGYSNGDAALVTAEFGGTLPGGSWSGLQAVGSVSGDTFTLGVNTSTTGNGMVRKVVPQVVGTGSVTSFAAGQLTFTAS